LLCVVEVVSLVHGQRVLLAVVFTTDCFPGLCGLSLIIHVLYYDINGTLCVFLGQQVGSISVGPFHGVMFFCVSSPPPVFQ